MATDDPVLALIEQLRSSDRNPKERAAVVEALGKLRDSRAVKPLLPLARDKRWEVQGAVAKALGLIGDMRALDTLRHMYDGETYPLIESDGAPHRFGAIIGGAAIGLAHLYSQHGNPEIFETLTDRFRREITRSDDVTTACTVQGLPYTNDRRVTPMLIQAVAMSSAWLRYCALEALGVLGDPDGLPTLYSAVRDGDPLTLVWAAADALAFMHDSAAEQPLVDGLQRLESRAFQKDHLWYQARAKMVRALGIIGTTRARLVLEQRFNMKDDDQQTVGAIGLAYMHDKRVLQTLINGLAVGDWWTQAAAATALGELGDPAAIPALMDRLPNTNTAGTNVGEAIRAALLQLQEQVD